MKKLVILFALFPSVVLAQFQSAYCHEGRSFWIGLETKLGPDRYRLDLAAIARYKAQGVDWFGLTYFDEQWQTTGVLSDLFPLRLQLELASTQSRVVLRTLPWLDTSTGIFEIFARADAWIENTAKMLAGVNTKRIAWAINPEPAQLGKVVSRDPWLAVPYTGDEFVQKRLEKTRRLEEWYDYVIPRIRKICPDLTLLLSSAGWGHLSNYEYLDIKKSYPNTIRTADAYFEPWMNIEKMIQDAYDFYKAMGARLMLTECGIQDRSKVGTLEEIVLMDRIKATCTRLKISWSKWLP